MKILQVGKYYHPVSGGVESVTYDITEVLNAREIKCDVLCTDEGNVTRTDIVNGYKVYRAGAMFRAFSTSISVDYIRLLRNLVAEYDVLHIHLPNPLANIAMFFAKLEDKKIVIHWHSDIIKQKKLLLLYKPLESWMLKQSDTIIGTTEVYINNSSSLRPFKNKCIDIPIGIDQNLLVEDEQLVKKLKCTYENKKIVFSLGRLVYYKGFEYLIEAAKELHEDYVILIGGTGPLKEKLESKIRDLGLNDKVFLTGRIENSELGSYYKACDIFCLPSILKSEAFGVVQLEAMSFGKPVIATTIEGSGTSWVNKHGVSGLNVPVKSPFLLAKSIEEIFKTPATYDSFSWASKARFEKLFKREHMVDRIVDIYKNL